MLNKGAVKSPLLWLCAAEEQIRPSQSDMLFTWALQCHLVAKRLTKFLLYLPTFFYFDFFISLYCSGPFFLLLSLLSFLFLSLCDRVLWHTSLTILHKTTPWPSLLNNWNRFLSKAVAVYDVPLIPSKDQEILPWKKRLWLILISVLKFLKYYMIISTR